MSPIISVLPIPGSNFVRLRLWIERCLGLKTVFSGRDLASSDVILIPGVGAFDTHLDWIRENGLETLLLASDAAIVGICAGAQIMFCSSDESHSGCKGLSLLSGHVRRSANLQIGFSPLLHTSSNFNQSNSVSTFYFCHQYLMPVDSSSCALATDSTGKLYSTFSRNNTKVAIQFHPEMSGASGIDFFTRILADIL